jgi:hypothetical protein
MSSGNWIIDNLNNALNTWNEKLAEIWNLITQSPETFKGGAVWSVILNIHDAVKAVGLGLLVLFFVVGVIKTMGSFAELKRPEVAVKMFIRFILAYLRTGTNDSVVQHCARVDGANNERVRYRRRFGNAIATGNSGRNQRRRVL